MHVNRANNRRGKTGNLSRKTGNIKGIFCPEMDTVTYRKSRDLDTEEIKKRWSPYEKC